MSPRYAIGVGAKRGVDADALADFLRATAADRGVDLAHALLAAIAGRDDAQAFRDAGARLTLPTVFIAPNVLRARKDDVLTSSPRVEAMFGVGSLCEALALTAAGEGSALLAPRVTNGAMACAIARMSDCVAAHPPLEAASGRTAL